MSMCKFQCQSCSYEWQNSSGPAMCPRCAGIFITWKNHLEVCRAAWGGDENWSGATPKNEAQR